MTLLALAVAGQIARIWILSPGQPSKSAFLATGIDSTALAAQQRSADSAGRPLALGEKLDLNTASAADLVRLPRIGPGLARRIVDDRTRNGPFLSVDELTRVPGVGAGVLRNVREYLLEPRGGVVVGVAPAPAPESAAGRLNLNQADAAELARLPGIGPTKARAIVAYRQLHGPFALVEELIRVPGIGPATLARLAESVSVK